MMIKNRIFIGVYYYVELIVVVVVFSLSRACVFIVQLVFQLQIVTCKKEITNRSEHA